MSIAKALARPPVAGLLLPLALAAAWELAARQGQAEAYSYAFPSLASIAAAARELIASGELFVSVAASVRRMLTGLGIGALAGLIVGGLMATVTVIDRLFTPIYNAVRQVPLLGLMPLITLWLGSGEASKLLLIGLAAFYPMVLNTYEGAAGVDRRYLDVAAALTLTRVQLYRHVLLPAALPLVLTGLSQAVAFTWISTIGVELLFSTSPGIGTLMHNAQMIVRMDSVIVCVVVIGLFGFLMNLAVGAAGRRLTRWRDVT